MFTEVKSGPAQRRRSRRWSLDGQVACPDRGTTGDHDKIDGNESRRNLHNTHNKFPSWAIGSSSGKLNPLQPWLWKVLSRPQTTLRWLPYIGQLYGGNNADISPVRERSFAAALMCRHRKLIYLANCPRHIGRLTDRQRHKAASEIGEAHCLRGKTVIARLDRATQYSRARAVLASPPRHTGSPGQAG